MRVVWALTGQRRLCAAGVAAAQSWQPPAESQRCPSKWGAARRARRGQSHEAGDRAAGRRSSYAPARSSSSDMCLDGTCR